MSGKSEQKILAAAELEVGEHVPLYLSLPRLNEAKIPPRQSAAKNQKAVLTAVRNWGKTSGVIRAGPRKREKMSMAVPMLSICPVIRIVPSVAEATP